jgi:hypothetical protein
VTGQDFLATLDGTCIVSGNVSRNCSGYELALQGTTLRGDPLALTTSTPGDFSGDYSFTGVPNGTYTITPVNFPASPASRTLTVFSSDVTGQDFVFK